MSGTQPTAATWTIRFRHHRTTVLLHVDPLQNISSIKSELLSALQQSCSNGKLSETLDVPDSAAEILLARPIDINDPTLGWKPLQAPATEGTAGKGRLAKGKGKAREGSDAEGVDAESLKSLGIKENALLAFTFSSARAGLGAGGMKQRARFDDAELRAGGESGDVLMDEDGPTDDTDWDVVMPSWEDLYGVLNEGDAGVLKSVEG